MNGISPWHAAAAAALTNGALPILLQKTIGNHQFTIAYDPHSLYISGRWPGGTCTFKPVYSPDGQLTVKRQKVTNDGIDLTLESTIGHFKVTISFLTSEFPILKYQVTFSPDADLFIPFWPRDIIFSSIEKIGQPKGKIHVQQLGTRSGLLHISLDQPATGSLLYFQNLSSLEAYNEQTQTSAGNTVGGIWPELGFALPPTTNKALKKGKSYCISDAIIAFDEHTAQNENELSEQYLNLLAAVYLQLPQPSTKYTHWPIILEKGLKDLIEAPGCWCQVDGNHYFNAYVSDYDTPPEIMVQLAVLLPLTDYTEWSGRKLPVIEKIKKGLPAFYDQKLKTIVRWLPAAQDKLKGEEEQKKPMVMDSWYLHHPLLNLSRMALKGDEMAKKLFLDSLPYATKVAKHFKYNWPVFYKMDTLEVIKAETKPGAGGQHDVAGLYAHVMLQAYALTEEKKYLAEAERAAKSLVGKGFQLFYQANNTSFSAGALLRLYKLTKNEVYLNLSNLCLANIFQNVQLWECNYGNGKHLPTFFALFPLADAPYTAVYEEQEVFCALHDYLKHAEGVAILPAIKLLVNEYIRNLVNRAAYYYPPMLPDSVFAEDVKIGEVDKKLWIALEDLHDGWEQSGSVGQEVYGAGNAFGILPRHYHAIGNEFMLFCDYPIKSKRKQGTHKLHIQLGGDSRIDCRIRVIPMDIAIGRFTLLTADSHELKATKTKDGQLEYLLKGEQQLKLAW